MIVDCSGRGLTSLRDVGIESGVRVIRAASNRIISLDVLREGHEALEEVCSKVGQVHNTSEL